MNDMGPHSQCLHGVVSPRPGGRQSSSPPNTARGTPVPRVPARDSSDTHGLPLAMGVSPGGGYGTTARSQGKRV